MSKRQAENNEDSLRKATLKKNVGDSPASKATPDEDSEMGEMEGIEDSDNEDEDEIHELGGDDDNEDEYADYEEDEAPKKVLESIQEDEKLDEQENQGTRVYVPQLSAPLEAGEVLEPDMAAYHMLHSFNVEFPSLSFDIIPDNLGDQRTTYPQTTFLVTGSQANRAKDNHITVLKLDQMCKTYYNEDDDEEEEGDDYDPRMEYLKLPTPHNTNRIRMNPHCQTNGDYLAASMSESGEVYIWDITQHYNWFNQPGTKIDKKSNRPMHTIRSHGNVEGYGIDWSPKVQTGVLLTGDMDGRIFCTRRTNTGWSTDKVPFQAPITSQHRSIEDIQWSPSEETVFASCGSDGMIRIWDTRSASHKPKLSVKGSNTDINVISWNKKQTNLMASGHDDGQWAVWDLRNFTSKSPSKDAVVASFDFHKQAITSIEFSPLEETAVAVGSEDSTVTLWDLSVEADDEEVQKQKVSAGLGNIPPQMMFMHWQKDVKEVHFSKQFPGGLAATGAEGFSVFKTISF